MIIHLLISFEYLTFIKKVATTIIKIIIVEIVTLI